MKRYLTKEHLSKLPSIAENLRILNVGIENTVADLGIVLALSNEELKKRLKKLRKK